MVKLTPGDTKKFGTKLILRNSSHTGLVLKDWKRRVKNKVRRRTVAARNQIKWLARASRSSLPKNLLKYAAPRPRLLSKRKRAQAKTSSRGSAARIQPYWSNKSHITNKKNQLARMSRLGKILLKRHGAGPSWLKALEKMCRRFRRQAQIRQKKITRWIGWYKKHLQSFHQRLAQLDSNFQDRMAERLVWKWINGVIGFRRQKKGPELGDTKFALKAKLGQAITFWSLDRRVYSHKFTGGSLYFYVAEEKIDYKTQQKKLYDKNWIVLSDLKPHQHLQVPTVRKNQRAWTFTDVFKVTIVVDGRAIKPKTYKNFRDLRQHFYLHAFNQGVADIQLARFNLNSKAVISISKPSAAQGQAHYKNLQLTVAREPYIPTPPIPVFGTKSYPFQLQKPTPAEYITHAAWLHIVDPAYSLTKPHGSGILLSSRRIGLKKNCIVVEQVPSQALRFIKGVFGAGCAGVVGLLGTASQDYRRYVKENIKIGRQFLTGWVNKFRFKFKNRFLSAIGLPQIWFWRRRQLLSAEPKYLLGFFRSLKRYSQQRHRRGTVRRATWLTFYKKKTKRTLVALMRRWGREREMKWGTQVYQLNIFLAYRRLIREANGGYREISKHRFFMKYFRVFFKMLTGYEERELRATWWALSMRSNQLSNGHITKTVQQFSEIIRLRLDSLSVYFGIAPSLTAARQFVRAGCMIVNGVCSFAHFYALQAGDVLQIIQSRRRGVGRFIYSWIGRLWFKKIRIKLARLRCFQVEWVIRAVCMFRWPRSYELPEETQPVLSERWLRFYIRFLVPVKAGKWRKAKLWWQVYRFNEKIFKRGGKVKYPGAGKRKREEKMQYGI